MKQVIRIYIMNYTPGLPTDATPKRSSNLIGPDQDRTNRRVSSNFRTNGSVPSSCSNGKLTVRDYPFFGLTTLLPASSREKRVSVDQPRGVKGSYEASSFTSQVCDHRWVIFGLKDDGRVRAAWRWVKLRQGGVYMRDFGIRGAIGPKQSSAFRIPLNGSTRLTCLVRSVQFNQLSSAPQTSCLNATRAPPRF